MSQRRSIRPHDQTAVLPEEGLGYIEALQPSVVQLFLSNVPDNPDYFPLQNATFVVPKTDAFAYRVFTGKHLHRQRLIDNDRQLIVGELQIVREIVAIGKDAASQKRNAQRAEVISTHGIEWRVVILFWPVGPSKFAGVAPSQHRHARGHSDRFHSGQPLQFLEYPVQES